MFAIEMDEDNPSLDPNGVPYEVFGRISVDDFSEVFRASLGYWAPADYRRSWVRAFDVIAESEQAAACLVTSMADPGTVDFVMCWPLYRVGDSVHIQNKLIILDQLASALDPEAPWLSIGPRVTVDEDGNPLSEWEVPFASVAEFFRISRPSMEQLAK